MLDLYRFNNADMEDVKLQDRSKTAVYDEGQWLSPLGNAAQEWAMSASGTVATDDSTHLAKILFMEKERTDSAYVGKMTCVSGAGVRGRTDQFIASEATSMAAGKPMTLRVDPADSVVKLSLVADPAEIVKAYCFLPPSADADGYMHFELVR